MSWSLRRKKERIFCTVYSVRRKFFQDICFISMYTVLNTLSKHTYFYISKNITSYTFLLVFKIVESLQCIPNVVNKSIKILCDKQLNNIKTNFVKNKKQVQSSTWRSVLESCRIHTPLPSPTISSRGVFLYFLRGKGHKCCDM